MSSSGWKSVAIIDSFCKKIPAIGYKILNRFRNREKGIFRVDGILHSSSSSGLRPPRYCAGEMMRTNVIRGRLRLTYKLTTTFIYFL